MATLRLKAILPWLPVCIICLAIFVQSCFPSIATGFDFRLQDKLLHFLVYGLLAWLTARALGRTWPGRFSFVQRLLLAAGFAALYGLSDELHQYWVPSRRADPYDLLADAIGALLGALAHAGWPDRRR